MADFWRGVGAWVEETANHAKHEIVGAPKFLAWAGEQASKEIEPWAEQTASKVKDDIIGAPAFLAWAGEGVVSELSKIGLVAVNGWINSAAATVQQAISDMSNEERSNFEKWLKNASESIGLQALLDGLQAIKLEDLPAQTVEYIKQNPRQTAFIVIGAVAFFVPALIYGPALALMGFGSGGEGAGTVFAS